MGKPFEDLTPHMRAQGYITTDEATELAGRSKSGSVNKLFIKRGVKHIRAGRMYYWYKEDIEKKIPPPNPQNIARGNALGALRNGGSSLTTLQKKVRDLEVRMAVMESYMNDLVGGSDESKTDTAEVFTLAPPGANLP